MGVATEKLRSAGRSAFVRVADHLSLSLGYLAAIATLLMMVFSTYDITARYLFNSPTSWVIEVSGYLLVSIAFLGASFAERDGAHIKVDVLIQYLSGDAARLIANVAAWLGSLFVCFATWQAALFNYSEYRNGTRFWGLLETQQWIPQLPMSVGLVVFAIAMLATIRRLAGELSPIRSTIVPALFALLAIALFLLAGQRPAIRFAGHDIGSYLVVGTVLISAVVWSGTKVAIAVASTMALLAGAFLLASGAGPKPAMLLLVIALCIVLLAGVSISLGLGLLGLLGVAFLLPMPQLQTLGERAYSNSNSFALTAVPMFILMGVLLLRTGVSTALFEAMRVWFGRTPGGLAHAAVGTSAGFAAVSGSSVATAATIGAIAAPEMMRRGYSPRLAYGCIAAGGTLGILIPPSIPMIIYGSMVGASVPALFVAGVIPGILLTLMFMGVVALWSFIQPSSAPAGESFTIAQKLKSSVGAFPFIALIVLVLGSLYWGVATPSEAGAVGALLALLLCLLQRAITWRDFVEALMETVKTTSFIMIILVGTATFTYVVDYLRLSQELIQMVGGLGLNTFQVFLVLSIVYIVLGMFIDPISMMLITLPVTFPMAKAAGFDPVWFGIYLVVMIEVGLLTPPVGMNLFVLRGFSGDVSLREIALGAAPFILAIFTLVSLIYVVPEIVTWLPDRMGMSR